MCIDNYKYIITAIFFTLASIFRLAVYYKPTWTWTRMRNVYFYSFPSGTNKQSFSDCTSTTNDTTGGRNNGSSSSNLCTTGTLKSQQELLQEQVTFKQEITHFGYNVSLYVLAAHYKKFFISFIHYNNAK